MSPPPERSTRARVTRPGPSTGPTEAVARPVASSGPIEADHVLLARLSIEGIGGSNKIPVSQAVSREYPIPQEIKNGGSALIKLYVEERMKRIEEHNSRIQECVVNETQYLREATRGDGVVQCPDCGAEVPWGSVLYHRTRMCPKSRI